MGGAEIAGTSGSLDAELSGAADGCSGEAGANSEPFVFITPGEKWNSVVSFLYLVLSVLWAMRPFLVSADVLGFVKSILRRCLGWIEVSCLAVRFFKEAKSISAEISIFLRASAVNSMVIFLFLFFLGGILK